MFDLINFLFVLTILLVLYQVYSIPTKYIILLSLHLCGIFIINGVLLDPTYMPDQITYLNITQNIRNFYFDNGKQFITGPTILIPSLIFGFFPIPFIQSVYSIALINFMIYLFLFVFLLRQKIFNSNTMVYFYLLYPSLFLYSSLALRDMLIFAMMFISVYFFLTNKRYIIIFSCLTLLGYIKFQNLLILSIAYFSQIFINRTINIYRLLLMSFLFTTVYILFAEYFSIERLNFYRWAFYNDNLSASTDQFTPLGSYIDLFILSIPNAINFFFRPLPWYESGLLQWLQFIENITLSILIVKILITEYKYDFWKLQEFKFLNMLLFLSLIVYGLVIFNSGTAARYKFPFIGIYILLSWHYIAKYHFNTFEKDPDEESIRNTSK